MSIVSNFGHCCSYTILEKIETETIFTYNDRAYLCPEDIIRTSNLCTALAFDNFDRFFDTSSGKDTLHDTVGIIFQNKITENVEDQTISINETNDNDVLNLCTTDVQLRKRRRTFEAASYNFPNYSKQPKLVENMLPADHPPRFEIPETYDTSKQIHFAWMLSNSLNLSNIPMWVGYNSLIYDDKTPQQNVSYLTTINASPTSATVGRETMIQAQRVANECDQQYGGFHVK